MQPPIVAPSIVAPSIVARPIVARPIVAPPIVARPIVARRAGARFVGLLGSILATGMALAAQTGTAQTGTAPDDPTARLKAHVYDSQRHGRIPYRLFTPQTTPIRARPATPVTSGPYPLVLFLHGAGERGNDNARQLRHGVAEFVAPQRQQRRPCFVLAPQSPPRRWWNAAQVVELLRAVLAAHPVDLDRVYLTGLSMGGNGTFAVLAEAPELFAAALPICGWGEIEAAARMAQVPVWAFHGQADTVVAPARSRAMIEALRRAGASPRYTEYPGVRHDSWTRTYRDPAVHAWLFAQRRASGVAPVALRHGDRIAFFGDSITAAGARGKGFIRLIEADLKRRLPDFGVALIGAGVSGNKVADLQQRLQRDVLDQRPTIVVIYIGINDVWHWNEDRGTSPAAFESGLRDLLARITKAGARVVLCTPTVIGEQADGTNRFDQMLDRYAAISRQVARSTGTQVLDLRRRCMDYLATHNRDDQARGILTRDTVHLNDAGNRLVADCMLRALGAAPRRLY